MNIITSLPLCCCFAKAFIAKDIVISVIKCYINGNFTNISGYSRLNQWSASINPYKCTKFKQTLNRTLRNAFIKHNISASGKNGYWHIYLAKQLSYAIFQKVLNYYDYYDKGIIQLLNIPTRRLFDSINNESSDFTNEIHRFLHHFANTKEDVAIDLNTKDPNIINALNIKYMIILENIVGDVDFIDNIVKRINDKYVNDEIVHTAQEQIAINQIVPTNVI